MGKKGGGDAPTPPDPVATAQAQGQMNKETAVAQANLNRIDQYTPQGSSTYTQIGMNADGTPQYRQDTTLAPANQKLYDQQMALSGQLGDVAKQGMGAVSATMANPLNYNNLQPYQTGVNGNFSTQKTLTPTATQNSIANPGSAQMLPNGLGGAIQTGVANAGNIQKNTSYADGTRDFNSNAQNVANSVYNQATSRLDPQFNQEQSDLASKLAAQGISQNSDAYRREMDNFARSKNDAYNQANYSAIQAGGAEQSRLFGMSLSADQFQNQAQAQQYSQNANNMQLGNQAQGQIFGQGAQATQLNNQAQDQNYQQQLGQADLYNQANQQSFAQQQAAAGFYNSAQSQDYNTALSQANFANAARQSQATEQAYLYNQPLNQVAALMGTAGPVQGPNFVSVPQVGVAAPDYQGLVSDNYHSALDQYNRQQAASGGFFGDLFGGLGSIAGGLIMSDRRAKTDIKPIGKLADGLPTYTYRYKSDPLNVIRFGVMAQDVQQVKPDAVVTNDNGVLMVNYGKVW